MKRCTSKRRQEIIGTGLGCEELSENEQLLEDLTERYEESECRTEVDTQKRQSGIDNKKKRSRNEKKAIEDLEREENVKGKMKVTLVMKNKAEVIVQKRLVFFEKNLSKFRSEDLQKAKNEMEARERQYITS